MCFFFNNTTPTELYTLSLHDALPIWTPFEETMRALEDVVASGRARFVGVRSEEHTSELQSLRHLVCRLLLEKKKKVKIERQEASHMDRLQRYAQTVRQRSHNMDESDI